MTKRITPYFEYHLDNFLGIQDGTQNSKFIHSLNATSSNSYEISEFGPCMNPKGFVSNIDCPSDNPYCNCPQQNLMPKGLSGKEPTDNQLLELLQQSNECFKIKTVLSDRWFGVDYSNPNCLYNCISGISSNNKVYTAISVFQGICGASGDFPYNRRKSYTENDSEYILSFVGITGTTGATGAVGLTGDLLNNFKDYLAYSRTNATFWNTPEKTPLLRKAQTSLLTYQRVRIVVNGLFDIKPGNTINLNIPTGESKTISKTRFDGRWMIYKIERIITVNKHSMILSLMRDGSPINPETIIKTISTEKA